MTRRTLLLTLAVSIAVGMLLCCKSATRESRDGYTAVTIDLNKTAPIGYEICAAKPPKLSHENLDLRITMPARFEIPPEQPNYGAKYVEFRPGQHDVDVYRNLHSARVLWTRGSLEIEDRVPTIHVKLPLAKLAKGRYVLGISGDPYFAYCTFDLQ